MSHCIPPRQRCKACRAEVRAAQMEEREWRKVLWRCEVGSKIALAVGIFDAIGAAVRTLWILIPVGAAPWIWWTIAAQGVVALIAFIMAGVLWPTDGYSDDRPEYAAAKVARDKHEKMVWETGVEILKAQEQARSELEELEDRIGRRMREMGG